MNTATAAAGSMNVVILNDINPPTPNVHIAYRVPRRIGIPCAFTKQNAIWQPLQTRRAQTGVLSKETRMFFHVQKLINEIVPDEPDPAAACALQEGLGGQFGEMRTMMQYLFQSFNARGKATPYKDLIQGIGIEEISHVELISTTINYLLDGSP